ncbi:lysine N(6)-hydroxylase/L-ornithine N(5)-oxygenase family protein [Pseudomonas sp. LRF_L74]|uniref:lysine N(6)-hydroxylase/L-ornithine N(5)-oxygenase family protein n=1 Tax=Pseudomonas sp. LRF_L74 TaxID=3369422 RepID=UPI003F5E35A6
MTPTTAPIHDIIGVGFGPSNIALAIALEEISKEKGKPINSLFLEKQEDYWWHGDTLASGSEMQISFLKDLVSLRNPTSPYSFVNYLHQQNRLIDFINLSTFYPCRMEFNDYLRWVAKHFSDQAFYGQEVFRIEPEIHDGAIDHLRVLSRDNTGREQLRRARSIVIGTGGTPNIPRVFKNLQEDPRIFHHSRYISGLKQISANKGPRIAIIGSGQSAAEAFIDIHENIPNSNIDMIMRSSALKPADDSPFVNEIFAPATTDLIFNLSTENQEQLLDEYKNTNYSVVDLALIENIYGVLYRQKVSKKVRHELVVRSEVHSVKSTPSSIEIKTKNLTNRSETIKDYDIVILATGYKRKVTSTLLSPLKEHLREHIVERDYRIISSPEMKASIYLQGFCESTHGLSDTLLSVLPIRADEIGRSLYKTLYKTSSTPPKHNVKATPA